MERVRKFFSIESNKYVFEVWDITAFITILNVAFILLGFWWAPFLGLVNCLVCIVVNVMNKTHINNYVTQIALIVLNIYFLTM